VGLREIVGLMYNNSALPPRGAMRHLATSPWSMEGRALGDATPYTLGSSSPTFRRIVLPPSSGSRTKSNSGVNSNYVVLPL
jgi:hypothetical protein